MAKHPLFRWFQFGVLDLLLLTTIVAVVVALWRTPNIAIYYEPLAEGATPGQHWDGNGLGMKFRWCPPGQFTMGSPRDEELRLDNEDQVSVTISRGFWLGKCEVTQREYRQVMNDNPSYSQEGEDPGYLADGVDADRLPVDSVSWESAGEFCRRLTAEEVKAGRLPAGWEYRLPTEAQWEYACRAGTQTAYCFGNDKSRLGDFASWGQPHEVGEKLPNAWGLRDMYGNVWEWCRDEYQDALVGGTDPEVVNERARGHVVRGGCWFSTYVFCRSAGRTGGTTGKKFLEGFRVALVQSR